MPGTEQPLEPLLIEQHFLVRRTPEGADLLLLVPSGKGRGSHPQRDELFEVCAGRIIAAQFPGAHGATGDAKPLGQTRLRQTYVCAQRQHQLPEGIVALPIKGSLHGQVSFLPDPPV